MLSVGPCMYSSTNGKLQRPLLIFPLGAAGVGDDMYTMM